MSKTTRPRNTIALNVSSVVDCRIGQSGCAGSESILRSLLALMARAQRPAESVQIGEERHGGYHKRYALERDMYIRLSINYSTLVLSVLEPSQQCARLSIGALHSSYEDPSDGVHTLQDVGVPLPGRILHDESTMRTWYIVQRGGRLGHPPLAVGARIVGRPGT